MPYPPLNRPYHHQQPYKIVPHLMETVKHPYRLYKGDSVCNALIVILLFLVDFNMFYVFYMIYVNMWCGYLLYNYLCDLIK